MQCILVNIGMVNSTNLKEVNNYSFIDNMAGIPVSPLMYYRLQEVDIDGHSHYSKIVTVNPDEISLLDITIYPNPAKNYFNLISSKPEDLKGAVLSIVDLSGQVLLKQTLTTRQQSKDFHFFFGKGNVHPEN